MRTRFFATIGIGFVFVLLSPAAGAYTYDTDNLPYSDTAPDQSTAVSVSLLTELGIVEGNPDGTFRFNSLLNRAEYMQIVMRLEPTGGEGYTTPCFPDVPVNAWYTDAVCRAKALGIVRGNADPNRDSSQWRFEPSRPVLYAEAVKVLAELYNYDVPTVAAGEWYEPYLIAARRLDTALPESPEPGMQLTRGDMARLTARFIAEDEGELSQLMIAQSLPTSSSSSSESSQSSEAESSVDSSSVSSGTGSSLSSSSSVSSPSSSSVTYDAQALPAVVTSAFLPMGEVSPVVGAATIFSEQQPLDVDRLVVRLLSGVSSVDGLLLYDDTGRYLGRATRDSDYPGDRQYALRFIDGTLTIPKEEEWSFYARADVKAFDEGGVSGQVFQISRMGVEGTVVWTNKSQ